MFRSICTACVYALAIGCAFCFLWAWLSLVWEQLKLSRNPNWTGEGNTR